MSSPNTVPVEASDGDHNHWFTEKVHAHDSALRSYLNGSCPTVRASVDDVVQESYLRIWMARAEQPIQSARAFLFRVARNVVLDLIRHNRASPIDNVSHLEGLAVLEDGPDAAEFAARRERINLLAQAIAELPHRCREIFILHKIKGYSRKEVAAQLGLSDRTVGVQSDRAVKRCADFLRKRGVNGLFDDAAP